MSSTSVVPDLYRPLEYYKVARKMIEHTLFFFRPAGRLLAMLSMVGLPQCGGCPEEFPALHRFDVALVPVLDIQSVNRVIVVPSFQARDKVEAFSPKQAETLDTRERVIEICSRHHVSSGGKV